MDKKDLLMVPLEKIMLKHMNDIGTLVNEAGHPKFQIKKDGSPVTFLDIALSGLVERIARENYQDQVTFYSEENFNQWSFPLLAVDPLDGTKEYIAGIPEWALSIGLFSTESFSGQGWVYNPMTKECFTGVLRTFQSKQEYSGEVSRSEWDAGLFKDLNGRRISLRPMGSIAYKLGRLSDHYMDFVVSLRPKNIWDIAGGTLLCKKAGLKFYSQGREVNDVRRLYEPPLIWCHEGLFPELSKIFS